MTTAIENDEFVTRCDECHEPITDPKDCYAVEYTTFSEGAKRAFGSGTVRRAYPGTFHGRCTTKARERLDAERTRKGGRA